MTQRAACRQQAQAEARGSFQLAAKRPPGRAPALPVHLPPWHLVGQCSSRLRKAYGGFWSVLPSPSEQHPVPKEAGTADDAVAVLESDRSQQTAPCTDLGQLQLGQDPPSCCPKSLRLLEPRWQALCGHLRPPIVSMWCCVVVHVPGKGACHVGGALLTGVTREEVGTVAGFVTSAVLHRDSNSQPAGVACVSMTLCGGDAPIYLMNPYAADCLRLVTVSACAGLEL
jgi:hypothetical protein